MGGGKIFEILGGGGTKGKFFKILGGGNDQGLRGEFPLPTPPHAWVCPYA